MTERRLPGRLAMTAAVGMSAAPMTGGATARRSQKGAMSSRPLTSVAYDVEDANDALADRIEDNAGWQR